MTPHDVKRLEIESELAKQAATQAEARAKIAALEAERAWMQPQVVTVPAAAPSGGMSTATKAVIGLACLAGVVYALRSGGEHGGAVRAGVLGSSSYVEQEIREREAHDARDHHGRPVPVRAPYARY